MERTSEKLPKPLSIIGNTVKHKYKLWTYHNTAATGISVKMSKNESQQFDKKKLVLVHLT